jgi:hypothetical protein
MESISDFLVVTQDAALSTLQKAGSPQFACSAFSAELLVPQFSLIL